jgi:hypothetical protein
VRPTAARAVPLAVDYLDERGRYPACCSNTHTRKL